ncbi:MAG: acyl-ACP thioesterase domain-containing protein [Rikenellaceae bacterium]
MPYLDHKFEVNSCDMDVWGFFKPISILHVCQDVAYMHSSKHGFGFDELIKLGAAWVLSRVKVEAERLPAWREKIRVRTWHKGQVGIFSLRDYIFYDEQDHPIIRVTTSWLIINIATRRIMRADRVFASDEPFKLITYQENAIETEAERVELPESKITCAEHKVVYSDLDVNHHVNNAKYLEWSCDQSPQQMQKGRHLSSFCLNFNHEAKFGEKVSICQSTPSEDEILFEGDVNGRNIFTARLYYSSKS